MKLPDQIESYAFGRDAWGVASLLVATGTSLANLASEEGIYRPNPWIFPVYVTSTLRIMNSLLLNRKAGKEGEMARMMRGIDNMAGNYALFAGLVEVLDMVVDGALAVAPYMPHAALELFTNLGVMVDFGEQVFQQPVVAFSLVAASLLLTVPVDVEKMKIK